MAGQSFPNLRHARLFLMVAGGASVHATARHAGLTQPAVTLCLAALENFYGVALFERRPTGLTPTKYATVLSERVARCIAFLTRAIRKVPREADAGPQRIEKLLRALTVGQLVALVAMERQGGFAAAAESLGVRVPSLHRALGGLESAIGVELLYREKRGARLNTLGHEIALLANLGLEELRLAAAEVKELDGLIEGTVTIGAVRASAGGVLSAAILRLSARHPRARFSVTNDQYEEMLLELRAGRLDCMVSTARPNVPADFTTEELCQTDVRIICRRDHPLAGRRNISARELATYRWIGNPPRTGIAIRFRAMFEEEGVTPPEFTAQSELFELTRSLVLSGEFLALTVRSDFGTDYEHQGLVALDRPVPNARRPIWLICRHNWKPTRLHELFVETLREVTRRHPA
ncbi:MAG: LysR family transcriptional regulator [Proteobacteria bacterium]|nr:LysR family transcriptional regulator [Pseudomonadota bacterium]